MILNTFYNGVELHREEKIIFARFLHPHAVLSTCRLAGGLRTDLQYLYNHQSCEPAGHSERMTPTILRNPAGYRQAICERHQLPAEFCATLGTAANMNHACTSVQSFRDLTVAAVCTGGVEGNAGRAGDPASVVETTKGFEKLPPVEVIPGPGTINTLLFISRPLIPGALTRCIMTATEAKTAVLHELAVNSRYSPCLATGTGTDQIAVAAMADGGQPLTSAGKHAKLGELIGLAVYEAIKGTLARQNNLTPAGQCSAKIHLERFGLSRTAMQEKIRDALDADDSALFASNFRGIERDPMTVATVAAMVHLYDKMIWGVLPWTCWTEVMASSAAQIAAAVSGAFERIALYRQQLAAKAVATDAASLLELACAAIALGFADKWRERTAIGIPPQTTNNTREEVNN